MSCEERRRLLDEWDAHKAESQRLETELNERRAALGDRIVPWGLLLAVNEAQLKEYQAEAAYQKHIAEHRCLEEKSFVQNA